MGLATQIDSLDGLNLETLKLEDLQCLYFTGSSYLKQIVGRHREYGYRSGVMTPVGDVLNSIWREAAESIIKRDDEWQLQLRLRDWYRGSFDEKDNIGALSNHCRRLYNDPNWVDYQEFQGQNADLLL